MIFCRLLALAIFQSLVLVAGADAPPAKTPPLRPSPMADTGTASAWQIPQFFQKFDAATDARLSSLQITKIIPRTPAQLAGLQEGDRILAIAGYRVHDLGEFNTILSVVAPERNEMLWTVVRKGQVVAVTLRSLLAWRRIGAEVAWVPSGDDHDMAQLATSCGIIVPARDRTALQHLPGRAAHAFQAWLTKNSASKRDSAWLRSFIDAYLHVLRCEPLASLPAPPIPVPFLAELDHFYRALAADRAAGDRDPDLARLGVERTFFAVCYPWPSAPTLELGPAFGDPAFFALLQSVSQDPTAKRAERDAAGDAYRRQREDFIAIYMGQVKAWLIDQGHMTDVSDTALHEGKGMYDEAAFRSSFLWDGKYLNELLDGLRKRYAAQGPDAPLYEFALVAALIADKKYEEAVATIERIGQRSSYLASRAVIVARGAINFSLELDKMRLVDAYVAKHPSGGVPPMVAAYTFCLDRSERLKSLAANDGYDDQGGRPGLFRDHADLVYEALDPDSGVAKQVVMAEEHLSRKLVEIAAASATDARLRAPGDAVIAAGMTESLLPLQVDDLLGFLSKGTIADCYAFAGDFTRANAWMDSAVDEGRGINDAFVPKVQVVANQQRYLKHQPPPAVNEVRAVRFSTRYPDGTIQVEGGRFNGVPEGRWCFYHPNGKLCASGSYLEGKRTGIWRRFSDSGQPLVEAAFVEDHRCGRWRVWRADGTLACVGWYGFPDRQGRLGRWAWFHADGQLRETGLFLDGKREGRWLAIARGGKVVGEAAFSGDHPNGTWPDAATLEEPPSPIPEWATLPEGIQAEGVAPEPTSKPTPVNDF